jgi:hypothetical protein
MSKQKEYFVLTRVHRDDMKSNLDEDDEEDIAKAKLIDTLTSSEMERICSKAIECLCDSGDYYQALDLAFDKVIEERKLEVIE